MFKFEIHLHTSGTSKCGRSTAREMIDAAKENGYSGIVLTNHFYFGNTGIDRNLSWEEFVDSYEKEYLDALEYGKANGIKVFFGIEEKYKNFKEVLVYGITPEQLKSCKEYKNYTPCEKLEFFKSLGATLIHAHPFRDREYIPNPDEEPDMKYFDGIECYNHFNKPEENVKAFLFAKNHNTIMTSGCDVHNAKDFGNAGIAFFEPIETYEQLIENLRNNNFKLISPFGYLD